MAGANATANPLKDCAKFSLWVALAGSPNAETYGFAAVSKIVKPQAITNKATKK